MSSVKLWLKTLTQNKINILSQFDNIYFYDLRGKSYNEICRAIFRNYYKNDVVLIGKTKYELPIPPVKKNFNKDNIIDILRSTSTATFSFKFKKPIRVDGVNYKTFTGDTYKLWAKSYLMKQYTWDVDELFRLTFRTDNVLKVKAWGIRLNEIENYPEHLERLMKAKLSYPIYVYGDTVIDGYHRLIKAKLIGAKEISYYKVTAAVLKRCHIMPKELRKCYTRGKGFVVN